MDDPIEKLARMLDELTYKGSISQSSNQWLKHSLNEMANGNAKTMDEAFGVNTKTGISKSGARLITFKRNQVLKKLLELNTDKGMGNWVASVALGNSLKKFKATTYLRMKKNSKRLNQASEVETLLFKLLETDKKVPCSASVLFELFD